MSYAIAVDVLKKLIGGYGSKKKVCRDSGVSDRCLRAVLSTGKAYPMTVRRLEKLFRLTKDALVVGEIKSDKRAHIGRPGVSVNSEYLRATILSVSENMREFEKRSGVKLDCLYAMIRNRRTSPQTLKKIVAALPGYKFEDFEVEDHGKEGIA